MSGQGVARCRAESRKSLNRLSIESLTACADLLVLVLVVQKFWRQLREQLRIVLQIVLDERPAATQNNRRG